MKKPAHIVIDARIRRSSTGRYMDRLITHLQSIDNHHEYTVLVMPDDDWKMQAKNFHTLPCPYPQFSFSPMDQIKFAWQLYRLKPDLVHFTMTQQPLLYFGNIVTTTHDLTMFQFVKRNGTPLFIYKLKIRFYHFLVWWSHRKSKRIIVPTKWVANEITQLHPFAKNRLAVTYEASEPPLEAKPVRPDMINAKDDFIMYVGTAFPHKNLERLVDAFDILHKKYPKLKLVLVGKKERHYHDLEKKIAKHPSRKNIVVTDFVPDESLKWLYQHCRAYVFASLSEGFGLPPLEAMSHGAPVVSSDASCMPEVYGDAAHYFNAREPEDIAAKVAEVLDDEKLREKLIKNGYTQLKKYSWRKMAEETLAIYKSVLKK